MLSTHFLIELTGFRRRAVDALGFLAGPANAGFFLGALALLGFAQSGISKRMSARVTLVIGESAQHDARGFWGNCGSCGCGRYGSCYRFGRCAGALGRGATIGRWGGGFGFDLARTGDAAFDLFDDDGLAAAVAEALAHHALFDAGAL